jgi:protein translocase SEC61 complex gamma subunit
LKLISSNHFSASNSLQEKVPLKLSKVKIAGFSFQATNPSANYLRRINDLNAHEFLDSTRRLIHVTTKPSRDEISLMVKISFLGVAIVGSLGFVIRVLFLFFNLLPQTQTGTGATP